MISCSRTYTNISSISLLLLVVSVTVSCGVNGFLINSPCTTQHNLQVRNRRGGSCESCVSSPSSSRSLNGSALNMVQTKSGGRPIQSLEQFQIEVLNHDLVPDTIDDNDDDGNNDSDDSDNDSDVSMSSSYKIPQTPILVFYSAPWCGPCRLSNPVVRDIIKQFVPRIDVVEVCTDDLPEIAEDAGVVSIPTIQIYHEGNLLDTIVGCVAKNVLASAVNKILEDLGLDDGTTPASLGSSTGGDVVQ